MEGRRSPARSGVAVTTCRHRHSFPREPGPWSHHLSKLEGGKGKGPERDGAEGDLGSGGRGQTSQGSSNETGQLDPARQCPWKIPHLEGHLEYGGALNKVPP